MAKAPVGSHTEHEVHDLLDRGQGRLEEIKERLVHALDERQAAAEYDSELGSRTRASRRATPAAARPAERRRLGGRAMKVRAVVAALAALTVGAVAPTPAKLSKNQREAVETLRRVNKNGRDGRYDLVYDELHPVQQRWMTKADFVACMPAVRVALATPGRDGSVAFPALDPFPELGKVRKVRKPDTFPIEGTAARRARSVVIMIETRQPDQDRFSTRADRVFRSGKRWTYTLGGTVFDSCKEAGYPVGTE
jgi:hypothetical protein